MFWLLWLQISRQSCQEYGVMKDSQMWQGTSSYPNHSIPSTCSGAPCFLLHISCYHAQGPFLWFPHVHSVNYTCAWTHILQRVSCRSRTHPLLSQGCRTIAILHQPFRNLLCFLFQWCRPEALVLQLCLTVYMIKCSICSYISWAISDKCYQSSYFSEQTDHQLGTEISPSLSPPHTNCFMWVSEGEK